jgi:hypothetical protein
VFPQGTRLTAGSRLLLVRNPAAFQARYGPQIAILVHGAYEGSLDNNGEELALVDAAGRDLQRFRYSHRPPWPDADGTGFSLVRLLTLAAEPGDPAGWRLSSTSGGNPGTTDARTFSGNPTADANGNGQEDLLDHAFGARIDDPVDGLRIAVGNRLLANGTPVPRVLVSYPRDPAAEDTTVSLLTAPSPAGPWSVRDPVQDIVTEERLPNGRLRRTHALAGTPDDPGPLFIRLAVSLTP